MFQHLDRHPQINLNELRSRFPDSGKKLITIFRNWKKVQEKYGKVVKKGAAAIDEAVSQQQLIKNLKSIVDKQKSTIDQQRQKIKELRAQLAKRPSASLSGITKKIRNTLLRPKK